ncbi:MAG: hypothetical protein JRC90_11980 [Deltaproteobacteria bacterium]|nr:hypothetical protein [Deltaproteobacteria bacterium]
MNNTAIYQRLARPPEAALRTIGAGRLKGKTDINPQWRYFAMTNEFGVIGIGWKFTIDKMWTEQGTDGQAFAFVNVSVFIKVDGEWSDAIQGTGGSQLIVKERNGMHSNDEAYKMATTDALSTALKIIGIAGDVYSGMQSFADSKYSYEPQAQPAESQQPSQQQVGKSALYDEAWALYELKKEAMSPEQCNWFIEEDKKGTYKEIIEALKGV